MKKNLKIAGYALGVVSALIGVGTLAYVFRHKPDVVLEPCFRSCHRADGCPKKAFDKPWKANWQSVKQLVVYGEVCNAYQVADRFYTGHSKNAFRRNIFRSAS